MAEPKTPLEHLAGGLEGLLRAGADALAVWQEQAAAGGSKLESLEQLGPELSRLFGARNSALLEPLRVALRSEVRRWAKRAGEDPAARRIHDLFAAILDIIEEDSAEREPRATRRPPPRKAAR